MLLDPNQTAAAQHGEGPLLIIAGPGAGKTRTITHRIAWLIEQGVNPANILAVTFTNKAGREMRERIEKLTNPTGLTAKTFHSWCVQMLRSNIHCLGRNFDKRFSIYDTDDQVKVYREIIKGWKLDSKEFSANDIQSLVSYAKNQSLKPRAYLEDRKFPSLEFRNTILSLYDEYHKVLEKQNAVDFDDLLLFTVEILRDTPSLRAWYHDLYRHILVDEYQDTNKAQNALITLLVYGGNDPTSFDWTDRSLVGVGDDGQGIFSFRGAIPENMIGFGKSFPGTKIVKLERNYRSTVQITSLADTLIKANTRQLPKTIHSTRNGPPVNLLQFRDAQQEAAWIANRTYQHLQRWPNEPIFIIYRTNAMSRQFESALHKAGIPYQLVGGLSFYERKEIKDMIAYLRVIANPKDDLACRRVINEPSRGIGETTIAKLYSIAEGEEMSLWEVCEYADDLSRHIKIPPKTLAGIKTFRDLIQGLQTITNLREIVRQVMDRSGYERMLLDSGKEEDLERLENLGELLNAAAEADAEGLDLGGFLDRVSLQTSTDSQNSSQVSLITCHSVKGLEGHTCFVPGWEEGILPHSRSMDTLEEIEEERRVAYVAITRPSDYLYITHCQNRMLYGTSYDMKPSRFLADIEGGEVQHHSLAAAA